MSDYIPDRWVVVKISGNDEDGKETIYKVLGSWYGGYLSGHSWRLNSGISSVVDNGPTLTFHGYNGSTYLCSKQAYGAHGLSRHIVQQLIEEGASKGRLVTMLSEEEALSLSWCHSDKKIKVA